MQDYTLKGAQCQRLLLYLDHNAIIRNYFKHFNQQFTFFSFT